MDESNYARVDKNVFTDAVRKAFQRAADLRWNGLSFEPEHGPQRSTTPTPRVDQLDDALASAESIAARALTPADYQELALIEFREAVRTLASSGRTVVRGLSGLDANEIAEVILEAGRARAAEHWVDRSHVAAIHSTVAAALTALSRIAPYEAPSCE